LSAVAILKLQAAGFTSEQVTALAELVDTQAATKADLEATEHRLDLKIESVKSDLEATEHRLDQKIEAVEHKLVQKIEAGEHRLDQKIGGVEHKLDQKIDGVEHRLELQIADVKAELRVLKWMTGFVLAFLVAIVAKLFLHL